MWIVILLLIAILAIILFRIWYYYNVDKPADEEVRQTIRKLSDFGGNNLETMEKQLVILQNLLETTEPLATTAQQFAQVDRIKRNVKIFEEEMEKEKYQKSLPAIKIQAKGIIKEFIGLCSGLHSDGDPGFITDIQNIFLRNIESGKLDDNYSQVIKGQETVKKATYDIIVTLLGQVLKSRKNKTLEEMFKIALSQSALLFHEQNNQNSDSPWPNSTQNKQKPKEAKQIKKQAQEVLKNFIADCLSRPSTLRGEWDSDFIWEVKKYIEEGINSEDADSNWHSIVKKYGSIEIAIYDFMRFSLANSLPNNETSRGMLSIVMRHLEKLSDKPDNVAEKSNKQRRRK